MSNQLAVSLPAYAFVQSLRAAAAKADLSFALLVGAELGAQLERFTADVGSLVQGLGALEKKAGVLQRWAPSESGPFTWGIARGFKAPDGLGFIPAIPFVVQIVIVSGALATAAWYVGDVLGLSSKTRDEAALLRARTTQELLARAKTLREKGRPEGAEAIERALAEAEKAAGAPPEDIFDKIANAFPPAAAGAGMGAIGMLALLWFVGGLSGRRKRNPAPRYVRAARKPRKPRKRGHR